MCSPVARSSIRARSCVVLAYESGLVEAGAA